MSKRVRRRVGTIKKSDPSRLRAQDKLKKSDFLILRGTHPTLANEWILSVVFSLDGKILASCSNMVM
jgi:uncharacterized Fe-S cluster-containing radical SAM superfamily protein